MIKENGARNPRCCEFKIGIVKDNRWALSTELKRYALQIPRGCTHDFVTDLSASREGNLVNAGMICEFCTRIAKPRDDIHHTIRETNLTN